MRGSLPGGIPSFAIRLIPARGNHRLSSQDAAIRIQDGAVVYVNVVAVGVVVVVIVIVVAPRRGSIARQRAGSYRGWANEVAFGGGCAGDLCRAGLDPGRGTKTVP